MFWLEITLGILAVIGGIVVYAQHRYDNGLSKYSPNKK
ncbi:hypothetical protein AA20_02095 [Aliarcobacter butzleri L348]|uniref:Uncharacterized protein n=1 Tax=Aliarcobacter butzleri L348 TaxID=1447256 RepID=A0A0G9KC80_9BACT|nr:hypothetical protein AA20_02095 [Aliarcobacter butzleri L348]